MNRFLKFALGVAVLGVVGLVGLGVMSIIAALAFSRSANPPMAIRNAVPVALSAAPAGRGVTGSPMAAVIVDSQQSVARANALAAAATDVASAQQDVARLQGDGPANVAVPWSGPTRVQVNYGAQPVLSQEWSLLLAVMVFLAFVALLFAGLRFALSRKVNPSDDTVLVQELARRAQEMSQRMESLETILLDRTRAAR